MTAADRSCVIKVVTFRLKVHISHILILVQVRP